MASIRPYVDADHLAAGADLGGSDKGVEPAARADVNHLRPVRETSKPIVQVARDLGIHDGILAN